jgi:FAD/FMN-containing dehydrogenase
MHEITRRQFARRTGQLLGAAGVASQLDWLAAAAASAPSRAQWGELARRLNGRLVLPGDAAYAQLRLPFNRRYAFVHPAVIAVCSGPSDVRKCLQWSREHGVAIAARSGGHSYAGFSTTRGLVIDVSRLRGIRVDDAARTISVGAGARNTDVYNGLQPHGVAISAGRCPSVGIAGLTLGGGFGFSSRKLGLTSDSLLETRIITASGRQLTCSERENPDLFWACRGGGGGNFGINTAFKFRTTPVGRVSIYDLAWHWRDAAKVAPVLQEILLSAPNELSLRFGMGKAGGGARARRAIPTVTALGQYFGPPDKLAELLRPALRVAPTTKRLIAGQTFWQAKDYLFHTTPRDRFLEKSSFIRTAVPDSGFETMMEWVQRWPASLNSDGGGMALFGWGGAISRVGPRATAFVHRDAIFLMAYATSWTARDSVATVSAGLDWIDRFFGAMKPYVAAESYQNFLDPNLGSWKRAYYGQNLERLERVKRRYDPGDRFRFAQSIPRV